GGGEPLFFPPDERRNRGNTQGGTHRIRDQPRNHSIHGSRWPASYTRSQAGEGENCGGLRSTLAFEQANQRLGVAERIVHRMVVVLRPAQTLPVLRLVEIANPARRRSRRSVVRNTRTSSCRSSARNKS